MQRKLGESGVALVTMLLFLVIVTALATGAIMMATVQVKVAGSLARWEKGMAAVEGGHEFPVTLISVYLYDEKAGTPNNYLSSLADANFRNEVSSPAQWGNQDAVTTAPDLRITVGDFNVNIDIDSLGPAMIAGGSADQAFAYHGAGGHAAMSGYSITSRATSPDNRVNVQCTRTLWLKSVI